MGNDNQVETMSLDRQILEQIPTPILTVDKKLKITFLNSAGCKFVGKNAEEVIGKPCHEVFKSKHCSSDTCGMQKAIQKGESSTFQNECDIDGATKYIECNVAPLINEKNEIVGGLESILDVTQRVLDDHKLREQSNAIREMSTPTIKLWEGILVLPVIGVIDSARAQFMMESILNKILASSSKVIILDIHGVAAVDTAVANHLIKITKATKLMGCECLLSGISPAVAQTIIQLGINMTSIRTNSTLSDALKEAFSVLELEVVQAKG